MIALIKSGVNGHLLVPVLKISEPQSLNIFTAIIIYMFYS